MDRLDDPSGNLGPEAISTTPAEGAKANLQAPLTAGYLRHTVWLRFKVPALPPEHEPGDLWLLAQPTYLDFVTLYQKGSDGAWRIQKLRMAYREMDGSFRSTMVPKDWVPDEWDTPNY